MNALYGRVLETMDDAAHGGLDPKDQLAFAPRLETQLTEMDRVTRNIPGLGPQVLYQITDEDAARVVRGVALTAEVMFAAGARRVLLPFDGAPEAHDPAEVARLLARPVSAVIELFTVHLMGTARMSEYPGRGVVDSYGAFHGVRGLFVADASLFPGPIGVNPMETILALVTRNAHRMIDQRDQHGI